MASLRQDSPPYTIHNLPYGVISTAEDPRPRCAVAIDQYAIDLALYASHGRLSHAHGSLQDIFAEPALNSFAALDWDLRRAVRAQLQDDIQHDRVPADCLVPLKDVKPHLPMQIGGYSDFYTSLEHCQNCSGEMAAASIPKNWFHAPSVYNSRVSSLLPTPCSFPRPSNVSFSSGIDSQPRYGPSTKLDFELEMGYFVSQPVALGHPIPIADAKRHIFGFVLLNDWSARDHQLFEMRPLGPFHAKGFATGVSNWIIPMEALDRFACAPNTTQNPPPFPHLTWPGPSDGALDVHLRVSLVRDGRKTVLANSNLKYLYWTPYQQLAHHAASGCGMQTGDLVGTGTISGSGTDGQGRKAELGCLYEAERTKTPVMPARAQGAADAGYEDGYLEDGDEVVLEGWCVDGKGEVVLGFGECRGKVLPPR